ncbi:MAG TPA: 50S ribosomal protein L6 [Candidatus Paceibacterota bacterium]|nr:50S ribosomal protein L6 [Candidatus Paceibacterota bacterium]
MSKIGKKIINLPAGVEVQINVSELMAKGPKGELKLAIFPGFKAELTDKELQILPPAKANKQTPALWGTLRALINNMVVGVSQGYEKKLELEGIGFKAAVEGDNLILNLGFSHPVKFPIAQGLKITVVKNLITISGIDKDLVGRTAAEIRSLKKPEPYKGKGIHYLGEVIRRKAGKKAAGTTSA